MLLTPFRLNLNPYVILMLLLTSATGCSRIEPSHQLSSELTSVPLAGTWAKVAKISSSASALGIESQTTIFRYSLVTLQEQDGSVLVADKPCNIRSESSGGSSLRFPQALIDSLPNREYSYQVSRSADAVQLSLENNVEILGATLANPLTDPMPKNKEDPAVIDMDGDGQPGISVEVTARALIKIKGTMYLAQRQIFNEQLSVIDAATMQGKIIWRQEQSILGSSNPILSTVVPTVTPLDSTVTLKKLNDGASCDDVK